MSTTPPKVCVPCGAKRATHKANNTQNLMFKPKANWSPSFWVFVDENNKTYQADSLELVLSQIIQFRHENKQAPIPFLKEVVINFTMLSNDAYQAYRESYTPSAQVQTSALAYLKGALAYTKAKLFSSDEELYVEQKVAEKRAAICAGCPYNKVSVNGRTKHDPSLAQSKFCELKEPRRTSVDGLLHLCAKCNCKNECKIHFTKEFIYSATTQDLETELKREILMLTNKPGKCWIYDDGIE